MTSKKHYKDENSIQEKQTETPSIGITTDFEDFTIVKQVHVGISVGYRESDILISFVCRFLGR